MFDYIKLYLFTLLTLGLLDFAWLLTMVSRFYQKQFLGLFQLNMSIVPAIIFYLLYAAGLTVLIIVPNLKEPLLKIFLFACLFGLVAYGTYDLTNQATIKNWPMVLTVVDMFWGMIVTGLSSVIAVSLYNHFLK